MPRLLCIDDYQAGLRVRKAMLESRGCTVFTAESGARGLMLLEDHAVDAVILDYRMEGMDGQSVAWMIKAKYPRLPIILLTGFARGLPEQLLAMVDAYVVKGGPPARLLETIERVAGRKLEHAGETVLPKTIREEIERSRTAKVRGAGFQHPRTGGR